MPPPLIKIPNSFNPQFKKAADQLRRLQKENRCRELEALMFRCIAGAGALDDFLLPDADEMGWVINQTLRDVKARMERIECCFLLFTLQTLLHTSPLLSLISLSSSLGNYFWPDFSVMRCGFRFDVSATDRVIVFGLMSIPGNAEPGTFSGQQQVHQQQSVNFSSAIPIKKRRFPVFQPCSPPREEKPSVLEDQDSKNKEEPNLRGGGMSSSEAKNSASVKELIPEG